MELTTDRLKLRLIEIADLTSIHNLHILDEIDKYNTLGIPENIDETHRIIETWIAENQLTEIMNYTFAIEKKIDGLFIGLLGFKLGSKKYKSAEVWYKIHTDYWNQGFATEALEKIIDFGFKTLKLHRIEAGCAVGNIGSIKVLEKSGMIKEGRKRKVLPLKSGWSDNYEYAILASDIFV